MPRTSVETAPYLYSGQVAIANLGPVHFATYFLELPANSDPTEPPLQMTLAEAAAGFLGVGNAITLKTYMAFTNSLEDAQHYSNGITLIVSPPAGAVVWDVSTYITPLSDGPKKIEYLFYPGTRFQVTDIKDVVVSGKSQTEFYLQVEA